jgi:hypothetical protein
LEGIGTLKPLLPLGAVDVHRDDSTTGSGEYSDVRVRVVGEPLDYLCARRLSALVLFPTPKEW